MVFAQRKKIKKERTKTKYKKATIQGSVNSSKSLSALNGDYKCDTFGLEHLHKSWPEASWGNDTPASGKAHFKNAHARFWNCPKLELRHYWRFINNHEMIAPGVPPYVRSDLWMETRTHSRRFPLCAAVRRLQSKGWEGWARLHLRATPRSKFSASVRHQWDGGTTGRRPLCASLGATGPLRTQTLLDHFGHAMSSAATGSWTPLQQFLSQVGGSALNWRRRAEHISAWTQRVR